MGDEYCVRFPRKRVHSASRGSDTETYILNSFSLLCKQNALQIRGQEESLDYVSGVVWVSLERDGLSTVAVHELRAPSLFFVFKLMVAIDSSLTREFSAESMVMASKPLRLLPP